MPTDDVIEVAFTGTVGGERHVHTLHFRYLSDTPTEATLLAALEVSPLPEYLALFWSSDTPVERMEARQVCGVLPLRAPAERVPASAAGTITPNGERVPTFLAELVSWRTPFAGRSYRGRSFVGGLSENHINGNQMVTGTGTRYALTTAYADEVLAVYGTEGTNSLYRAVVWSPTRRAAGASCANASPTISGYVHPTLLSTMRSRRPGSGS